MWACFTLEEVEMVHISIEFLRPSQFAPAQNYVQGFAVISTAIGMVKLLVSSVFSLGLYRGCVAFQEEKENNTENATARGYIGVFPFTRCTMSCFSPTTQILCLFIYIYPFIYSLF